MITIELPGWFVTYMSVSICIWAPFYILTTIEGWWLARLQRKVPAQQDDHYEGPLQ